MTRKQDADVEAAPQRVPSSMALSVRLMIAITAAACVTLAIAVWYINGAMHRGLIHEHEEILADHLAAVRQAVLKDSGQLVEATEILHTSIGGDKNEKSYGKLITDAGQVLLETPGFSAQSPPLSAYPAPVAADVHEVSIQTGTNASGNPVFLAAARIARRAPEAPLTYYVTADALPEQHFMNDFRLELAGVAICGTLLSAGLGWLISKRGLRPVNEITLHIESTTAEALQHMDPQKSRRDERRWPHELARLSASFTALRSRLSRSFLQLRQFSDDAAHEIRSPLNNMLGLASFTLQRERTPEEYKAALLSTLEECERLKKLADGLLFISRADHRRNALTITTFEAETAIREVVEYHEVTAHEKDVELVVTSKGTLSADRTLFRQALTNLLSNALRHTGAGGRITVNFQSEEPAVNGDSNGRWNQNQATAPALLTVADSGEGIAAEHLPRIFDRFYRVDSARTHTADAPAQTGLGLAIVKAIVEIHGGTVSAASEPGEGTVFTLRWPNPAPHPNGGETLPSA